MTGQYDAWKTKTPPEYEDGEPAPARRVPRQKPGQSKQDYGTPWPLIRAVEMRFGPLVADLAASPENAKAPDWIGEGADALKQTWSERWRVGNLWLNPPYERISPWAEKCVVESARRGGLILLLVPASAGSVWFDQYVAGEAFVLFLRSRLVFEGATDPYPKDLMLCVYGMGFVGFDTWRWKE